MPPAALLFLALPLPAAALLLARSLATQDRAFLTVAVTLAAAGTFLAIPACVYMAAVEPGREVLRALPLFIGAPLAMMCSYRIDGSLRAFPPGAIFTLVVAYLFLAVFSSPSFDPLIQKLHTERRLHAAVPALPPLGAAVPIELIGEVAAALGDEDRYVRRGAASTLKRMAPASVSAVPALAHAALDPDAPTAMGALEALAALGPSAAQAVPNLVALLSEPHPAAKRMAEGDRYLGLEAADDPIKAAVARALGKIGPAAGPAIGPLTAILDGYYAGNDAIKAIIEISSEPVRVLEPFICDPRDMVAQNIRGALHLLNTPEARMALADGGPSRAPTKCKTAAAP